MRNIWSAKKSNKGTKTLVSVIVLIVSLSLMVLFVNYESEKNDEYKVESLKQSISQTITLCYSIEGQYPPSVQYMVDNYGFKFDEDKYFIHYESIGSNLMPMYEVFLK